ncbi:hypothetical protein KR100_02660 [Synechococcus sp. KORDI-100]|uniref:alpha-mannosidase n=1 Tax=Synechococcus sp. KORDI-100 TaxID=1280380 RepID=UPI0004E03237|nr:alpha-mannosidase [Synechococcus sp. KORDI-100]AII42302.1 hypothetical protein KR100_02660 [Synechococcus sp. KORDI-100]
MGHNSVSNGWDPLQARRSDWIETFRGRSRCDLRAGWRRCDRPKDTPFELDSWGRIHRPDWAERGLLVWPRGRQTLRLEQTLRWPDGWRASEASQARLLLSWWAEAMRLWVDGTLVHEGDLFDTTCRWLVPDRCREGAELQLQLELRSPGHDDGALIISALCLEPREPGHDVDQALLPETLMLHLESGGDLPPAWEQLDPATAEAGAAVIGQLQRGAPLQGSIHWIGHAHLDLAWLWPVADTWLAAERTFRSALELMAANPNLRFAHSTPALYAWLQRHRPGLFDAVCAASRSGRWEPINGPWVETDCVLVSTASLWQQFQLGQDFSADIFPEWTHNLAWLPDSFGFGAGLPAVAARTGIQWFCTHKLAWNADHPFPHRLFRWRSRGGDQVLSLMLPPIGRRADPLDMLQEQRTWCRATGLSKALWIPGVGDHGGGPTQEMLDQFELWRDSPQSLPCQSGTVRAFLASLEPLSARLPVWRDELYLELHRGCATSRVDQKRHNRSLERLLREVDVLGFLVPQASDGSGTADWRPLLFQQFHDILPGTSIPEVFEQAEPVWRGARRQARASRDRGIQRLFSRLSPAVQPLERVDRWAWLALQPLARWSPLLRLPKGHWRTATVVLPQQTAAGGGVWVQLPEQRGLSAQAFDRLAIDQGKPAKVRNPVEVDALPNGIWRISNGRLAFDLSDQGLLQLRDALGVEQLSGPLQLSRFADRGEFWDAWDLAEDYREHPLPVECSSGLEFLETGPLLTHAVLRYRIGLSALRLDLRLRADCPWLEVICSVEWQQRHELLRLELSLARSAVRFAADTSGGVLERPAKAETDRERSRWEVPVISWLASQSGAPGGGLALLLDGPQGVDGTPERMGVSLLRGPTWPDPGADQGWQRQRLALMPIVADWASAGVPQAAISFREPGWWGPLNAAETTEWLPALPRELVPVSFHHDQECRRMRLLNPGPRRCVWNPGSGWRLRRASEDLDSDAVTMKPGELTELILTQSS